MGDEEPDSPACYVTSSQGPCGPNTSITTLCNGGEGPQCTIEQVTSGWHYVAVNAVGNVGLKSVSARNCTTTTTTRQCVDQPDGDEICEVIGKNTTVIAGSIATGDPCPLEVAEM